jgi:hypothetical protein
MGLDLPIGVGPEAGRGNFPLPVCKSKPEPRKRHLPEGSHFGGTGVPEIG